MPRSSRAADFAAAFTIRSTFFVKYSALPARELAEAFSKLSSAAWADAPKIDNVARICVTTCKSRSKKQHSGRKRKSKFENSTAVTNAMAAVRSQAHARSIVRRAGGAVRSSARGDFFRYRKPVRVAAASARSSRNHAANATARAAWRKRAVS